MEDRFAATTSNPKGWRRLAKPVPEHGYYERLILLGATGLLVGAAAVLGLQAVLH